MIDNDASVSRNYQKLVSQGVEDLYDPRKKETKIEDYHKESIENIRQSLFKLFPDLDLKSLGNPLQNGTFRFTKGTSEEFVFENLSGGEKAAFDLILD